MAANCTVSTSGVAFGNYDPLTGEPVDSSGTISVSCSGSAGEVVNVKLSTTTNMRKLQGPVRALVYQLYIDANRTQIWGDGTGATSTISGSLTVGTSGSVTQNFYVYGTLASGQNHAEAGGYLDTLVVSLGW
jgi:spore coat protein U-like protein